MRDIVDRRYRIEDKLAAGGFGAIYRATDLQIGRPVALKVLHRELAGDSSVVARFRREASALAALKSPHTVTVYDVGETNDTFYIVMELLRGESLQDVFDRTGPLPWRRIAHIARGVCSSLLEAHAHGIVHRDLKPANIFLERHALEDDFVKVLDFGIAKILDTSDLDTSDLTRTGQMVGTFDYMAPEQMLGGRTTTKSDVFTLGVVLYEMLSGKRPFGDATGPAAMLMALLNTTPAPLSGMPPAFARIVMRCISRESAGRPEIDELDRVLAQLLDLDESIYGEADDTTLVTPAAPRPLLAKPSAGTGGRKTLVRGSAQTLHVAADIIAEPRPSPPQIAVAPAPFEPELAEGSSEYRVSPVQLRPTTAPQPPRTRLASGTSPIVNERSLPAAPDSTAGVALRWIAIAVCLFAVGFLAAIAISWM